MSDFGDKQALRRVGAGTHRVRAQQCWQVPGFAAVMVGDDADSAERYIPSNSSVAQPDFSCKASGIPRVFPPLET
jgi:hypothetical protein